MRAMNASGEPIRLNEVFLAVAASDIAKHLWNFELILAIQRAPLTADAITSFTRNIYEAADKREMTLQYFGAPNLVNGEGYGPIQQSITSEKDTWL